MTCEPLAIVIKVSETYRKTTPSIGVVENFNAQSVADSSELQNKRNVPRVVMKYFFFGFRI